MNRPSRSLPPEIRPEELQAWCHAGHCVQIVDVRTGGEFAAGRIGGAKLLPLAELAGRVHELEPDTPIVVVCQSGPRGSRAREELCRLGWTNVANLAGGMGAWARAGLPVEKDDRAPWSLERQVRVAAGTLVLLGVILGYLVHAGFFAVSAFVGAGLIFAGITDWCGMGLLLARAPWNRR